MPGTNFYHLRKLQMFLQKNKEVSWENVVLLIFKSNSEVHHIPKKKYHFFFFSHRRKKNHTRKVHFLQASANALKTLGITFKNWAKLTLLNRVEEKS